MGYYAPHALPILKPLSDVAKIFFGAREAYHGNRRNNQLEKLSNSNQSANKTEKAISGFESDAQKIKSLEGIKKVISGVSKMAGIGGLAFSLALGSGPIGWGLLASALLSKTISSYIGHKQSKKKEAMLNNREYMKGFQAAKIKMPKDEDVNKVLPWYKRKFGTKADMNDRKFNLVQGQIASYTSASNNANSQLSSQYLKKLHSILGNKKLDEGSIYKNL
jgi:hypothetical protein